MANKDESSVLVSIIVPVYNMSLYLKKCLDSICGQTLEQIEIICVNDGSTDNSLDILKEYAKKDKRIIVVSQENQGLSAARNTGLDIARGEYIGFVDSDDYISKDMYLYLYNDIRKNDADIAICSYYIKYDDSVIVIIKHDDCVIDNEKDYIKELLKDDYIQNYVWTRLYKRELFDDVRFQIGKVYEDVYLSCDLLGKVNKICYINKPLYYYCIRDNSISRTFKISTAKDSVSASFLRYCRIKEIYPELLRETIYSTLIWLSIMKLSFKYEDTNCFFELFKNEIDSVLLDLNSFDVKDYAIVNSNEIIKNFLDEYSNWCSMMNN